MFPPHVTKYYTELTITMENQYIYQFRNNNYYTLFVSYSNCSVPNSDCKGYFWFEVGKYYKCLDDLNCYMRLCSSRKRLRIG